MSELRILQPKRADYTTEKGGGQRVVECYVDVPRVGIFKGVRVNLDTQRVQWPSPKESYKGAFDSASELDGEVVKALTAAMSKGMLEAAYGKWVPGT